MTEQKKNSKLPWHWLSDDDHKGIRELGETLNALNFIEIAVVLFFSFISYELIFFIMDQIALGNDHMVLGALATGVFIPLTAGIWKMLVSMNETYTKIKER
jgi:hypothetical protein